MQLVTFGRFGYEKHWKKDKEVFLENLKEFAKDLSKFDKELSKKDNEKEIVKSLNPILKEKKNNFDSRLIDSLDYFILQMGILYIHVAEEDRKEIFQMDFTYDNWKNKSLDLLNNYKERIKKLCPPEWHFCFEDLYFIMYIASFPNYIFSSNNYLIFIRNFFILEYGKIFFTEYYNPETYKEIRIQVIKVYPELKEKYGMNRKLEKFLNFFFDLDSDYKYKNVAEMLDKYYERKNKNKIDEDKEEKVKLKEEQD